LRDQKFNSMPVQARIKSENLRKSFYYNYVPQSPYYYNGANYPTENTYNNGDTRGYKGHPRPYESKTAKGARFGGNKRRDGKGRRGRQPSKKGSGGPAEKNEPKQYPSFSMATSHWPPLPVPSSSPEGNISGYQGEFTKYPKEQFVSIINSLKNHLPQNLNMNLLLYLKMEFIKI